MYNIVYLASIKKWTYHKFGELSWKQIVLDLFFNQKRPFKRTTRSRHFFHEKSAKFFKSRFCKGGGLILYIIYDMYYMCE